MEKRKGMDDKEFKESLKRIGKRFGPSPEMGIRLLAEWANKDKHKALVAGFVDGGCASAQVVGTAPQILALIYSVIDSFRDSSGFTFDEIIRMLKDANKATEKTDVQSLIDQEEILDKLKELRTLLREAIDNEDDDDDDD